MSSIRRLAAEASTYPGARFTDDGYHAWAFAVQSFRSRITEVVIGQAKYDNFSNPQFAQLEVDVVKDFPVDDYLV